MDRTKASSGIVGSDDALQALDGRTSLLSSDERIERKNGFNLTSLKGSLISGAHEVEQEKDDNQYSEGEELSNQDELESDNDFDPIDSSPMYHVDGQDTYEGKFEIGADEDGENSAKQKDGLVGVKNNMRNEDQNAYEKILSLENQILSYKKKMEELDERVEDLEIEKEMAQEEKLALEDERNSLERQKDFALEKLRLMSIDYINIENKLEEKNKKEMELENKVKTSNEEIRELKEDHAILLEERNIFEEQNKDLLKNVEELNKKIIELVEQKTKLSSKLEHFQRDHEKLEAEHATMKEDNSKQIDSLGEEVGLLEEQLARIQGGGEWVEEYERENARYGPRIKQLGETNRNLEKQNRFLENQRSELQSRRDYLTIEKEKLLSQVEDLSTNMEMISKNMNSAKERHEARKIEFSEQKSRRTEEIKQAVHLNESLRQELDEILEKRRILENQVKSAEVETSDLLNKVENLESLKANINDLENLHSMSTGKDALYSSNGTNHKYNNGNQEAIKKNEQLQSEKDVLKTENAKLSKNLQEINDRNQRLEIQLSEMVDMMENRSCDPHIKPAETAKPHRWTLNLGSEDEGRFERLENEICSLRTQCSSMRAELLSKNEQISQLEQLRLSLDSTKRQLLEHENVIVELKSKIELNELDIKSKALKIEQLQQCNSETSNNMTQNVGDISHSTMSSSNDSFIFQYENMIEELKAKLDDAYVENGKLLHQLTQVVQRAQDDIKLTKIEELQIQNVELQRILRLKEEELIREQNRNFDHPAKSYSTRNEGQIHGEIVEGISELVKSSFNSTDKVMDVSLSQDLSFLRSGDYNLRSAYTPRRSSMRSIQPELQALKVQLGNLHEQLESKNLDVEKAIFTAQNLSKKLYGAQEKIQFMEDGIQNTDKAISLLRDELIRKQQVINEMELKLQDIICSQCRGPISNNGLKEISASAVSNYSMMIEKDNGITLKKNMQTVEYVDELMRVVSQQNNFANLSKLNISQSMQNIQQMVEGLHQQASHMQKVMEENTEILKRLAESAFAGSPKKQRKQTPRSNNLNRASRMIDDMLEIKREDLKAIVDAGESMINIPANIVSLVDGFAATVFEEELSKSGIEVHVQLFENYMKRIETFEVLQKRIIQDVNDNRKILSGDLDNNSNHSLLITSIHELSADNMKLSAQIKALIMSLKSKENIFSDNSIFITSVNRGSHEEVEKLRKLVSTQGQVIEKYGEALELYKLKEEQPQKEESKIALITNCDQDDQHGSQTQLKKLHEAWRLEVNANASLRIIIKEMKARSESKEEEMKKKIEILDAELSNVFEQLQIFKLRAEKFESKFHQTDASLKKQLEIGEKMRKEWNEVVEEQAKNMEVFKQRMNKERTRLKESSTKTKAQQLAELETNHKELEDSWKQEKETLNKRLRIHKETSEREIKNLQKEVEKLSSIIKDLKEEISSITANKKTLTLEKALLTKEKTELQLQLDNMQKDVASERASQKIKDLQGELQAEKEKTSKLNKEKNAAIKEKSELQRKYLISNEMKESLEVDIRDEKEHVKALEVEIQNITDQLQSERRDHQFKSEQLSRYEDELQAVQEQCNMLREKLEEMQDTLSHERNQFKIQLQHIEAASKHRGAPIDDEVKIILDKNSKLQHDLIAANNKLQELKESAQNEIDALQEEFQVTQRRLELMEELQAINTNSVDAKRDEIHEEYQRKLEEQDAKYKHKYQSELRNERKRYIEECDLLIKEIRYLKTKCLRESGFRADLSYQKKFMMLLLGGAESCEQATLLLISDIQNPVHRMTHLRPSPLLIKFRGAVTAILAIQRMRYY
ncbi:7762_t:CDS:10 [Acaulospora colombiana]|uniref:7762_t:CDS:1 n=1 Tax=Acaulospora colombiana TaxID=27376 RepID=A0ACA9LR55_9GLOM|nr:7762_t:CDS:10 [Acaulospora colombiana]